MITSLCNNKLYFALVLLAMVGLAFSAWFFVLKKESRDEVQKPIQFTSDAASNAVTEIKSLEPRNDYEKQMLAAAQKYWAEKRTDPDAQVILRDFGCHVGVEAVKNGVTVMKFQYDGSTITEYKEGL